MNTQSSALDASSVAPQAATSTATISPLQRLYWSVRRELWENRSIYIAPAVAGGVLLFGFLIGAGRLSHSKDMLSVNPAHQQQAMVFPYDLAAAIIMATSIIVSIFYCLEALHGERRDRSILFWKSLPVSDLTAVLAKLSIPMLILPLVTFAVIIVTQAGILLLSRAILPAGPATLWTHTPLFSMSLMLLYHLFMVHSIWWAPIYAWLLLVSAWARRAPFLWAFLPPIAIGVLEKIIFNTNHFAQMIGHRLNGGSEAIATAGNQGMLPIDPGMQITLGRYLTTPGLWIGLLISAIFLAAAVKLRRERAAL